MTGIKNTIQGFQRAKTSMAALLAVAVSVAFVGQGAPYPGVSPMSRAVIGYEETVFAKIEQEKKRTRLLYQSGVKERIGKIISGYQTGFKDPENVQQIIFDEAARYGFDPLFLTAVIVTESSFNNRAKSTRGALGLMQIRPATAKGLVDEVETVGDEPLSLYDPEHNIALGAYYLSKLIRRFGDLKLALEAYNHGPSRLGRILRKGKRPTRYSSKVLRLYKEFRTQSI